MLIVKNRKKNMGDFRKENKYHLTTKDNHNENVGVFQDEMSSFLFSI